jgi:hypothetical protein
MHWKILPLVFTGQCNPATKTIDAFKLIAAARPFAGLKRALLCSSVIACARGNADILGTARARFALVPSHVDSGQPPPHSSLRANTALSHARDVLAVAPCHLIAQVLNHSKNFSLKNHPLIIHHPCREHLTWMNHHPKLKFR